MYRVRSMDITGTIKALYKGSSGMSMTERTISIFIDSHIKHKESNPVSQLYSDP